ncbi:LSU ribosomal protein L4p (L1e) [hydrothermal vent metagenome]|uniref:LSU ribosomal protein L4p (L1e) n=1 Tax=hydrothermal vent metagenome TaxID=652676 RepID=A0A3B0QT46_9ZZZZ
MSIDVLNKEGSVVSSIEPNGEIFDGTVKKGLLQETVKMQMACRRSGNAHTKGRSDVAGSNAKPWKQKGSGRARAGTKKSPIWRSGGVAFGPKTRDYSYSMPKKAVKVALKSALQYKINEGKLKLFDSLELAEPKTKLALAVLNKAELKNALLVVDSDNKNLRLALRNLHGFKIVGAAYINVYDVLRYDELVLTKSAYETVLSSITK